MWPAVFLAILLAVLLAALVARRGLVAARDAADTAWRELDGLLLRRHDLLAALAERAGAQMRYEHDLLERLIQARARLFDAASARDLAAAGTAEAALREALARLLAQSAHYPLLTAAAPWRELVAELEALGVAFDEARERYNAAASVCQLRARLFPGRLLAGAAGISETPLFELGGRRG